MKDYRDIKQINKELFLKLGIYDKENSNEYGSQNNLYISSDKILKAALHLGWRFSLESQFPVNSGNIPYSLLFRHRLRAALGMEDIHGYSGFQYFLEPDSLLSTRNNQRTDFWTPKENINGVFHRGAHLSFLKISNRNNCNIDIRQSDLQFSLLENIDLYKSDLSGSNIFKATFKNCDFNSVDFRYSNLQHANLIDCNFDNANFFGANIDRVEIIRGKNLSKAAYLLSKLRALSNPAVS